MKHPIPSPREWTPAQGVIPAVFFAPRADPEFAPALAAFRGYAEKAFGPLPEGTLTIHKASCAPWEYRISVGDSVEITAADAEGLNHALATLLQLVERTEAGLVLPRGEIADVCQTSWRGLMLDLSRCWHELPFLYAAADLCWLFKANRLQLHLTDDQGVRFPFQAFPKVVHPDHYTAEELTAFADYCFDRGIVLVPEIDAPGHAAPFNDAYPELFGTNRGLMCAEEPVFEALSVLYGEVADLFPRSPYIHVGGDEAAIDKWNSCDGCKAYREAHGLDSVPLLYGHFVSRLAEIVKGLGRIPVVWEGFSKECNFMIPKDTLVFAWESYYQLAPDLLASGFTVLNASWKPLYVVPRKKMWEPEEILRWELNRWENWWDQSIASKHPILVPPDSSIAGGQMCVWGDHLQPAHAFAPRHEMIREEFDNIVRRFPALCEKLWNPGSSPDEARFLEDLGAACSLAYSIL